MILASPARPMSGNATASRLSLNPKMAIIHALMVLPILAPIIVPIAFSKLIIFAHTNPNIIKLITELLCNMAVVRVPEMIPLIGLSVHFWIIFLKNFPPTFFILIWKRYIPYKNRLNQPRKYRI